MPGAKGDGGSVSEMVGVPSTAPANKNAISIDNAQATQTNKPIVGQTSASSAGALTGGKGATRVPAAVSPTLSGTSELTLGNILAMAQQQGFGGGKGSGGK